MAKIGVSLTGTEAEIVSASAKARDITKDEAAARLIRIGSSRDNALTKYQKATKKAKPAKKAKAAKKAKPAKSAKPKKAAKAKATKSKAKSKSKPNSASEHVVSF